MKAASLFLGLMLGSIASLSTANAALNIRVGESLQCEGIGGEVNVSNPTGNRPDGNLNIYVQQSAQRGPVLLSYNGRVDSANELVNASVQIPTRVFAAGTSVLLNVNDGVLMVGGKPVMAGLTCRVTNGD